MPKIIVMPRHGETVKGVSKNGREWEILNIELVEVDDSGLASARAKSAVFGVFKGSPAHRVYSTPALCPAFINGTIVKIEVPEYKTADGRTQNFRNVVSTDSKSAVAFYRETLSADALKEYDEFIQARSKEYAPEE